MKEDIEKNGSEFVLLFVPNHMSFYEMNIKHNKLFNSQFNMAISDYIGKVQTFGSYNPLDSGLNDMDFADKIHLSHDGAIKYSNSFNNINDLLNTFKNNK